MGLLNTRRLMKSLLRSDEKIRPFILLATSQFEAKDVSSTLHQETFLDVPSVESYLKRKNVLLTEPKNLIPIRYRFNQSRRHLSFEFDIHNPNSDFNLILVMIKINDTFHIFDVKDIDHDKMQEFDGLQFDYHI